MVLAGDVGGTKCNLALLSEKDGKLTPVFKQRFASKEFAQFDRIVKEFSRQAAPYLAEGRIDAAGEAGLRRRQATPWSSVPRGSGAMPRSRSEALKRRSAARSTP